MAAIVPAGVKETLATDPFAVTVCVCEPPVNSAAIVPAGVILVDPMLPVAVPEDVVTEEPVKV